VLFCATGEARLIPFEEVKKDIEQSLIEQNQHRRAVLPRRTSEESRCDRLEQ
jgi:hypothetical protein